MVYHFGKTGYMIAAWQAAAGTAETLAGTDIGIPLKTKPGLKPIIDKEFPQYYKKTSSEASDYIVKRLAAEGELEFDAHTGGPLEMALFGVFGAVDSNVITDTTTGISNVFTMTNSDLPMWTVGLGRGALNLEKYYDLRYGKLDMSMSGGENVNVKVNAMGKGGNISQPELTPTYTTDRSFVYDDIGVSLGGTPNCDVTSLNLSIDRGMKSKRTACAASPKGDNVFYPTTINVEGDIEMFFQDFTEYKYWLGASNATEPTFDQTAATTKRALTITMSGDAIGDGTPADNSALIFTIPAISYSDAEIDMPWDDRMLIKFNFKALFDQTSETGLAGTGTIKAQVDSEFNAKTTFAA
jgi:hypothetical protein